MLIYGLFFWIEMKMFILRCYFIFLFFFKVFLIEFSMLFNVFIWWSFKLIFFLVGMVVFFLIFYCCKFNLGLFCYIVILVYCVFFSVMYKWLFDMIWVIVNVIMKFVVFDIFFYIGKIMLCKILWCKIMNYEVIFNKNNCFFDR